MVFFTIIILLYTILKLNIDRGYIMYLLTRAESTSFPAHWVL